MRNLKILTVMLFIGLFIGGNGCRKDEVFTSTDILSTSSIQNNFINPSNEYEPVFNTFHLTRKNIHTSDIISIWAPKKEHLASLVQELQNIPFSHTMMSKLIEMKKNGIRADRNYAMYNPIDHEDYFVAVPFFNQNNVNSILVYAKIRDDIDFLLYNSADIKALIQGTPNPEDNLPIIASFLNAIQYAKSQSVNPIINEFLVNLSEPNNRFLGTRNRIISVICTTFHLINFEENIKVRRETFIIDCGGGGSFNFNSGTNEGDGSGGGGSGATPLPIPNTVEKECIKILSNSTRRDLYELFETYKNPCDDDAESAVAEAINKECDKNTSSSNDSDGRDREISVNDAIDEKEFLNNIINELENNNNLLTRSQKENLDIILKASDLDISEICAEAPNYDLNECENALIKKYPTALVRLVASNKLTELITEKNFGGNGHNDCSDAYRHAMFNATNAFYLGPDIAKEFGDAHECANSDDQYYEGVMDLHNNAIGISVFNSTPKHPSIPAASYIQLLAERIC